ncbi:MAG: hypothetical protein QCI82_12150 [Candidatus Thermoplasmatota archaeon]|nr:hypothetical protein [Candidatus Thermoplasmatota archaeon]
MSRRSSGLFIGIGSVVIVLLMIAIAYREPIEKSIMGDVKEDEYRWFLKKPIRFMNLPNELKGELNYTFFPSGVCEQLPMYDSYDVRDISIANVEIMNSDIQNAYMHNATIHNCNIEDATFINSTIFNCWIGDNVTFINCPPMPHVTLTLPQYISEQYDILFDQKLSNYYDEIIDAESLKSSMVSSDPIISPANSSIKDFFIIEKTEITISHLYNIHNLSNFDINCSTEEVDSLSNRYYGKYVLNDTNININVSLDLSLYNDTINYYNYYGHISLINTTSNITWSSNISDKRYIIRYENDKAELSINTFEITGNNKTNLDQTFFEAIFDNIYISIRNETSLVNDTIIHLDKLSIDNISNNNHSIITNNIYLEEISTSTLIQMEMYTYINNNSTCESKVVIYNHSKNDYYYQWTDDNLTTTYTLLDDGQVIDPITGTISKRYIELFKKKVGAELNIYVQLTKDEIIAINVIVGTVGLIIKQAAALLALLWPVFGPAFGITAAIVATYFQVCWSLLYLFCVWPDNDKNLELKCHIKGYYASGACVTVYYYKYDYKDNIAKMPFPQPFSNPYYISGKELGKTTKKCYVGDLDFDKL